MMRRQNQQKAQKRAPLQVRFFPFSGGKLALQKRPVSGAFANPEQSRELLGAHGLPATVANGLTNSERACPVSGALVIVGFIKAQVLACPVSGALVCMLCAPLAPRSVFNRSLA